MRKSLVVLTWAAVLAAVPVTTMADANSAKEYIKKAEELSTSGNASDLDDANKKLELAETELDGVDAAAKGQITASIAKVREKLTAANVKMWTPKYTRNLDRVMTDAESAIGNMATWGGVENSFKELQADPMAKTVLGEKLDAAAKKFTTFKKLHGKKAGAIYKTQAEELLKSLETSWAEAKKEITDKDTSPNSRESRIESTERDIARARKSLGSWVLEEEYLKTANDRLEKVSGEFTQIALADRVKAVAETLNRKINLYKDDWNGYEAEKTGPTWEQYKSETGEKMFAFLAPKTREFIERQSSLLEDLQDDKEYQSVRADKSIKAIVDDVRAKRDAAYTKMLGFVTPVVEGALKSPGKDAGSVDGLKGNVRRALGEKSPESIAFQAKLAKKSAMEVAATTGAEDAKVKLAQTLHAKAEAEWPKLYEGMKYTTEIDLTSPEKLKGKSIGFLADNLMGYRFKPGDFYYATTIGGVPVAAKIDPALMKQITATETAIGRSLGDNDDDGKWDIIAVVTDKKVKLLAKRQAEATGTVDGVKVKVTADYSEPVDAVVIEIIAAKCGPFAGAKDRGVLKIDGTVGK